jgi:pterin-4a-carbinolamine dehydratase
MYEEGVSIAIPPPDDGPFRRPLRKLKAERVQRELAELPGWRLMPNGGGIVRAFRFAGNDSPQRFAALAIALGQEVGHSPWVTVFGQTVVCRLITPQVGGVTARDLELARRIGLVQ